MIGQLVSVTIVLAALIALDRPNGARRWRRFAAAAAFTFVVMGICPMLEAVIFPIGMTVRDAIAGLVFQLIAALVLGAVVAWSRRDRPGISPPEIIRASTQRRKAGPRHRDHGVQFHLRRDDCSDHAPTRVRKSPAAARNSSVNS